MISSIVWRVATAFALMLALPASMPSAAAQNYPARPIQLIVPFPPGGSNDIVARVIGAQLTERLGRQVVVDNRARL